jgi:hypothetical protein
LVVEVAIFCYLRKETKEPKRKAGVPFDEPKKRTSKKKAKGERRKAKDERRKTKQKD